MLISFVKKLNYDEQHLLISLLAIISASRLPTFFMCDKPYAIELLIILYFTNNSLLTENENEKNICVSMLEKNTKKVLKMKKCLL